MDKSVFLFKELLKRGKKCKLVKDVINVIYDIAAENNISLLNLTEGNANKIKTFATAFYKKYCQGIRKKKVVKRVKPVQQPILEPQIFDNYLQDYVEPKQTIDFDDDFDMDAVLDDMSVSNQQRNTIKSQMSITFSDLMNYL